MARHIDRLRPCLILCLLAAFGPAQAQQPDPQFRPGMPMPQGQPRGPMPNGPMPNGPMQNGPLPDGRMPVNGQPFQPMPQGQPPPGFVPPPMPGGAPRDMRENGMHGNDMPNGGMPDGGMRGEGMPQIVPLIPVEDSPAGETDPQGPPPPQSAIAPAAPSPAVAMAPAPPALAADAASAGMPWTLAGLAAALGLVLFGWWNARRRSQELALETQQLSRQQMLLKSAHLNLKAQSERLREQSILDPLTGVLNRQAFGNELREMSGHLANYNRPLNLLVFDLDHFKRINDQQGHLAGDAALKLVVGIVREHLVSADLFGRFGGDEFLIACADQPLASCQSLAEQIRAAVEKRAKTHAPPLPGLTLSMGLAQADADSGYNAESLFARADAALYEAKRRGRNCVVVADATLPAPSAAASTQRHL